MLFAKVEKISEPPREVYLAGEDLYRLGQDVFPAEGLGWGNHGNIELFRQPSQCVGVRKPYVSYVIGLPKAVSLLWVLEPDSREALETCLLEMAQVVWQEIGTVATWVDNHAGTAPLQGAAHSLSGRAYLHWTNQHLLPHLHLHLYLRNEVHTDAGWRPLVSWHLGDTSAAVACRAGAVLVDTLLDLGVAVRPGNLQVRRPELELCHPHPARNALLQDGIRAATLSDAPSRPRRRVSKVRLARLTGGDLLAKWERQFGEVADLKPLPLDWSTSLHAEADPASWVATVNALGGITDISDIRRAMWLHLAFVERTLLADDPARAMYLAEQLPGCIRDHTRVFPRDPYAFARPRGLYTQEWWQDVTFLLGHLAGSEAHGDGLPKALTHLDIAGRHTQDWDRWVRHMLAGQRVAGLVTDTAGLGQALASRSVLNHYPQRVWLAATEKEKRMRPWDNMDLRGPDHPQSDTGGELWVVPGDMLNDRQTAHVVRQARDCQATVLIWRDSHQVDRHARKGTVSLLLARRGGSNQVLDVNTDMDTGERRRLAAGEAAAVQAQADRLELLPAPMQEEDVHTLLDMWPDCLIVGDSNRIRNWCHSWPARTEQPEVPGGLHVGDYVQLQGNLADTAGLVPGRRLQVLVAPNSNTLSLLDPVTGQVHAVPAHRMVYERTWLYAWVLPWKQLPVQQPGADVLVWVLRPQEVSLTRAAILATCRILVVHSDDLTPDQVRQEWCDRLRYEPTGPFNLTPQRLQESLDGTYELPPADPDPATVAQWTQDLAARQLHHSLGIAPDRVRGLTGSVAI